MRIFVINLDRNTERLASTDAELRRFGLAYERFPAVSGRDLTPAERKACYRPFRARCVSGVGLGAGEIGCALSHVGVYRKMIRENVPVALVLEDDVKLSDAFPELLAKAAAFADASRPQVIRFSAFDGEVVRGEGIVRVAGATCTDAYLITLPAARAVASANFPVVAVADRWGRWARRDGLELYRACPPTVRQDNANLGTDVGRWGPNYAGGFSDPIARWGLLWKAYRALGCATDWLLWKLTGK